MVREAHKWYLHHSAELCSQEMTALTLLSPSPSPVSTFFCYLPLSFAIAFHFRLLI